MNKYVVQCSSYSYRWGEKQKEKGGKERERDREIVGHSTTVQLSARITLELSKLTSTEFARSILAK